MHNKSDTLVCHVYNNIYSLLLKKEREKLHVNIT